MWKRIVVYGALLGAGTLALSVLDYARMVRAYPGEAYLFLVAAAFLALGVWVGMRLMRRPAAILPGNPEAVAILGISRRELTVLQEIAAGRSNREIAARLSIAPDTVKTHVSRLYEKLEARRRTDAVNRARELGILQ